jgi:hypothetical protein
VFVFFVLSVSQAGDKQGSSKQQSPVAVSAQQHGRTPDNAKAQPAQKIGSLQATACAPSTAAKKAKLDPKDFMFTGLQSETRVKPPG